MANPELVRRFLEHRDVLVAFIYALTRDYDAAEEIFQEVALSILGEAEKGTAVGSFPAWAQGIARRRVADYYRKASRERAVQPLPDSLGDMVTLAFSENETMLEGQRERMKSLLECLKRMSGRSRQIVESFYHLRRSIRQIAGTLGWREDSVKVALCRARKALADCVQVNLGTQGPHAK
jgi:RNA polymerase sigma-70 factor (ECF subfamily)